jgi:hypothetical protein
MGAELTIHRPGETEPLTLTTDDRGEARFKATQAGLCAIRARAIEVEKGEFEGKSYAQKRYYSTLTFPIPGKETVASAQGDAESKPTVADPQAYALLKAAHDSRQTMPPGFPGVSGEVVFDDNGVLTKGKFTYRPGDGVELTIEGAAPEAEQWLRSSLSNALGHRRGGDFGKGDGRHPITFLPDDRSPLGRQIALNDGLQSSYRIRDKQVTEVARTMGGQRFIITVLETQTTEQGKYLPRHFTVTYFDAESGAIQEAQSFTDSHARVKGVWLPTSRRVIFASKGRITSRRFELRDLRLMPGSAASR